MESVALDKEMKDEIISDIEWFFKKRTIDLYKKRGIAHRRGYLFYGAPRYWRNEPLPCLQELFRTLPERCLVLLDDLDTAGIIRDGSTVNDDNVEKGQGRVTMATLLGVLDGIGSHEYLLVATTNVKPDLDPALTRHGRIDKQYEFQNPDRSTLEDYFNHGLATEFAKQVPERTVTPAAIQEYFLKCNDPAPALAEVSQLCK
ncbi:uncharacterized protein N7483_002468 [Penicillium malachiteum]|uniref:uncharacterized protein n=1 Tax=Penicillium malachiteum TaxID=1324776 RepID=UPI002547C21B|nr:uncharacterized protein N7483_002468 [Penicillium malachiteum]KAJ5737343.1 hypothetical protein N7483_002468 [Penicillium malachiteum]